MTHNVFDSCVPTFILAGQSNTLGHNIEARDLPPWLRARAAAFEASVVTMGMNASRCRHRRAAPQLDGRPSLCARARELWRRVRDRDRRRPRRAEAFEGARQEGFVRRGPRRVRRTAGAPPAERARVS